MVNTSQPTGFVTYIDESGDEGFVFNSDGSGSSRWFVLSAVVTRRFKDLQMVECLRETRRVLGKAPKSPLHFSELKHEQRVPYIRRVERTFYRHEGKVLSYGMKFWPEEYEALKRKIPQIEDLEDFLD